MKKSNDKKTLKDRFEELTRKKPIIEDAVPQRPVRHIEKKLDLPFLKDIDVADDKGKYGAAEDVEGEWGLTGGDSSLKVQARRRFIGLIIAAIALILILGGVFYILPRVLPGLFEGTDIELFEKPVINLEYDDETVRVVLDTSVSVMASPDPAGQRLTEVLYNEPVTCLNDNGGDYIRIRTSDGIEGYIPVNTVTTATESVEPDMHLYKIVVSDPSKNIMTHASNGTLMRRVVMNTVLYADIKREGVYQVYLPTGESGWIGSSGVIELGVREDTEEVSSRYFVSSLLTFVNARYLENGVTMYGASINGAIYVCAEINGIDVPRTVDGLMEEGEEIDPGTDAVTGELLIENILPGDVLFLRSPVAGPGDNRVYEMAVCTDTGTLLMQSKTKTTIRLANFEAGDSICDRIITIRRIFRTE